MSSSTEGTNGYWKGLARYDELLAACPPIEVTANEKKRKVRRPLKPANDNQKKQKVLESFYFCPPAVSLTDVAAVEIGGADDLMPEAERSAAARRTVEFRDSNEYMMFSDDDVVPVDS